MSEGMKGKGMEAIKSPVIASEGNNQHVIASEGNNQHVIASEAKQSRAFAKMQRFFLDCFVASLFVMTCHLLPLRNFSRLRFPHFQFSIFNC
jgi:hypothetical protein